MILKRPRAAFARGCQLWSERSWPRGRAWQGLRQGVEIVWQALWHFAEDGGTMLAGHIAFAGLFALFPFLIFLTTLAGEIGQGEAARNFIEFAFEALPQEVAGAIRPAVEEVISARRTGLMTISILVALWAVSSGIEALRTALNLAYGIDEPRPIWWRRLQSLAFTILLSVSLILVMIVIVAGPFIWSFVTRLVDVPVVWGWLYGALRYTIGVGLLYVIVVTLYTWLPNRRLPRREILPGAAVTVVLWIGLASLFSLYLQNLGRFTVTYGSLGGIVITLLFFYLSAAIFIFGAELNSARRRTAARQLREERARRRGPSG